MSNLGEANQSHRLRRETKPRKLSQNASSEKNNQKKKKKREDPSWLFDVIAAS